MTELLADPAAAAAWAERVRARGETLGFVPTMGALHEGHLALVRAAAADNDRVLVSIFVNPLQFDERADFEHYPRDLARDARLLAGARCDAAFTGTLEQFFPGSGGRREDVALEDPGPASAGLEGDRRPGHFAGVATIVRRLFELVRPTRAYFGEKDFQQTLVVRRVAERPGTPEVVVRPTEREASGLARSSRNERLDARGREEAARVARGLFAARDAARRGVRDADALLEALRAELRGGPLEVEYAELRDPEDWAAGPLSGEVRRARALVAVRLGGVRLIDNLLLLDGGP